MEGIIVTVCFLMLTACAVLVVCTSRESVGKGENGDVESDGNIEDCETAQKQRDRAKDAYYMRNFWNYDGSEQQEWDEQGQ